MSTLVSCVGRKSKEVPFSGTLSQSMYKIFEWSSSSGSQTFLSRWEGNRIMTCRLFRLSGLSDFTGPNFGCPAAILRRVLDHLGMVLSHALEDFLLAKLVLPMVDVRSSQDDVLRPGSSCTSHVVWTSARKWPNPVAYGWSPLFSAGIRFGRTSKKG